MAHRSKVLLLIPHLGGGGAARVVALLASGLSAERHDVHLGLVTQAGPADKRLPEWVTVHSLGAGRVRSGTLRLLRLVRRLKPDVILSGMAHLNFLVLLLRPFFPAQTPVLVRQNGTVSTALAFGDLPAYTHFAFRMLYRRADRVICQTQAMAEDLVRETSTPPARITVLPNPIDLDEIRAAVAKGTNSWSGPGPHLLAVGRLARVKGFDLLLHALAGVREHFPDADLLIAGNGPEEAVLKALCRELGLQNAVRFVGHVDQPTEYFAGATAFVLSSRHEGLPNALLEAAAAGLPIVALPASQGLVDLIQGQPGIWLASEVTAEALTNSLLAALHTLQPGQRFAHPFVEQFSLDQAIRCYEQLIDVVTGEKLR
jgi:glycosyltransferase involved in cell wall biosynthesis